MDSAAKQHLRYLIHLPNLPPCPAIMSHEGWQCWVADTKMTSDPADAIHHHIFSLSLHDHLAKEKPGWPPKLLSALFNHMDWVANGDALRGYPPLFQLLATKHISSFCSVKRMMKLWGLAASDTAPLVNAWKEHNMSPSAHTLIMMWCGKRPSMGWLHGLIYPTPIQRYGTAFA